MILGLLGGRIPPLLGVDRRVWEDKCGDAPEFEFGGEAFALAWGIVDDPLALFSVVFRSGTSECDEEGMRGLIGVVEYDLPTTIGERGQVLGEFGRCDSAAEPGAGI